jgi:SagB-type dehydrogenase family enzyme
LRLGEKYLAVSVIIKFTNGGGNVTKTMLWLGTSILCLFAMGCADPKNQDCPPCEDKQTIEAEPTAEQNEPTRDALPSLKKTTDASLLFQKGQPIHLSKPNTHSGKTLMEAISTRISTREYDGRMLSTDQLSNLLYAAHGISRKDTKKRTTPTAMNWQDMEVYVATATGLFLYEADAHSLLPVLLDDIRAKTGKQDFVATAPINLIYVSDYSKMSVEEEDKKRFYSGAHAGFISQNVYLYCASEGLATVVRALFDSDELKTAMKLSENKHIVLAQTVGYPK